MDRQIRRFAALVAVIGTINVFGSVVGYLSDIVILAQGMGASCP